MATSPLYRIRTLWSGVPGTPFLTTQYFDDLAFDAQACSNAMGDFWDAIANHISNDLTYEMDPSVEVVDPVTGQVTGLEQVSPQSGVGSNPGDILSLGTNGLVNLRTGVYVGGRMIRGKLYTPGPTEAEMLNGTPISSFNTDLTTAAVALTDGSGPRLVVYSPTHSRWEPAAAVVPSQYFARLRTRQR